MSSARAPSSNDGGCSSWLASIPSHLQSLLRPADRPTDKNKMPASQAYTIGGVKLSDLIGKTPSISIFGSYTRQSGSVFPLLDGNVDPDADNKHTQFIVLAPSNKAITKLPRVPWRREEDEAEFGTSAYEGSIGQARADANIERFVKQHILAVSTSKSASTTDDLWVAGAPTHSLTHSKITYEVRDGTRYIQPGDIRVLDVATTANNGELWTIDGTLSA